MSVGCWVQTCTWSSDGNVFVVGDLHGCYDLLMHKLQHVQFDFERDLLVSVGDLVDRGQQNVACADLIAQPWFRAIRGNHEQLCIKGLVDAEMQEMHRRANSGGEWFYQLDSTQQQALVARFERLPLVLELRYGQKKYGFVHADIAFDDWDVFKQAVLNDAADAVSQHRSVRDTAMWSRGRIRSSSRHDVVYPYVHGVDEIYLGHTVTAVVEQHENCFFIDTGGVFNGNLTLLQLRG